MDICITGHRPDKLYGYNLDDYRWQLLRYRIANFIIQSGCKRFYDGMALGTDTVAALACLDVKSMGRDVKLIACLPTADHGSNWFGKSVDMYKWILSKCDEKVVVCSGSYAPYKMQERNKYMVDRSGLVLAVWDGSPGGTANCVNYAREKGKKVINLLAA